MHVRKLSLILICPVLVSFLLPAHFAFPGSYETTTYLLDTEEKFSSGELYKAYVDDGLRYFEQENYEKAKEAFWNAANLQSQVPDAYVNLGIVAIKEHDYEGALRLFTQAENLAGPQYPKKEIIYYNLGIAAFMQYDYQAASGYFLKALDLHPEFGEAMYYLGRAYDQLGQGQEALVTMTKARNVFQRKGQVEYAQKCGDALMSLNDRYQADVPLVARNLAAEGIKSLEAGNDVQAISFLRESILLDSKNANLYHELGTIYASKSEFYEAIEYYREALKYAPNFTAAYISIGEAYVKIGKHEEALDAFKKALALDKNNSRCYYDMGVLFRELDNENTAEKYFKEARRIGDGKENYSLLKTMPLPVKSSDRPSRSYQVGKIHTVHPQSFAYRSSYTTIAQPNNKGNLTKGYYVAEPKAGSRGKRVNKFQKTPDY
ncbi:MAG: tetratricopeptide repeat protein [Candidatus Omnitrophica bacterium]|nr:tetratricopeptide repeat protein [Candidatus Omnitrophota bacterium]